MARKSYEQWRQEQEIKTGISLPLLSGRLRRLRDARLKDAGFLPWERVWLIHHKLATPAMKMMIRDRRRLFKAAKLQRVTWGEYQKRISSWYRKQGWTFKDGRLNPYKVIEWYRKRYDLPDTPQPKKRRIVKSYATTRRRTEEKLAWLR